MISVVLLLIAASQDNSNPDRYPEAHALLREASADAAKVILLRDRSNPHSWAGELYARAGYLDEAAREYRIAAQPLAGPPYPLWRARVIYGDLEGAEKTLLAIADPQTKAGALDSLGDLLWRMGRPEEARLRFEAARRMALTVANPDHRKRLLTSIDQGLEYLSHEPPGIITANPSPGKKFDLQQSPIPLFPINPNGYRDPDSSDSTQRAEADADFMTQLYTRIAAKDREGVLSIADSANTPFRKALGYASIEHLAIQASQPAAAEEYAMMIPESDSDCRLARAEALGAAAAAWLKTGDSNGANRDFKAAVALLKSIPDLQLGKVLAAVALATAQFKGGMVASSADTFQLAVDLARQMPLRPPDPPPGVARPGRGKHYRGEAFGKILDGAIRAHDLGNARATAHAWLASDPRDSFEVAKAWLQAGLPSEALAFAHNLADNNDRIECLLLIARDLLDTAGAPSF